MVMYNNQVRPITILPVFTRTEMRAINQLIQKALLSEQMQQRLLNMDATLQVEFNLSNSTWDQLTKIEALSMADFCGELLQLQDYVTA